MKFGSKRFYLMLTIILFFQINLEADDKIISSPLINLENLEPSFELEEKTIKKEGSTNQIILNKKKLKKKTLHL